MILNYYEKGKGNEKTIIFLHGSASDASVWLREINTIASHGYHCYAIDLRGHGESKEKDQHLEHVKLDLDTHLHDMRDTLEHLGFLQSKAKTTDYLDEQGDPDKDTSKGLEKAKEKVIIASHSFGGVVAINLAKEFPDLVEKLIMVSLPPKLNFLMKHFLNFILGKPLEVIQDNLDFFKKAPIRSRYKASITTDAHVLKEIFKHVKSWDCYKHIPYIKCPVHLAAGRFDFLALANDVKKFHERIPGSTFELFKWSSHALMEDEPEKFERWLLKCLAD